MWPFNQSKVSALQSEVDTLKRSIIRIAGTTEPLWLIQTGEITERDALEFVPFASCVKAIADDIAGLPRPVYQNETREKAKDHPVYRLLNKGPMPWLPSFNYWHSVLFQLLVRGNCYSEIIRDRAGQVSGLALLDGRQMAIEWQDRRPTYMYAQTPFAPEKILHFRWTSSDPNALVGTNPLDYLGRHIKIGERAANFASVSLETPLPYLFLRSPPDDMADTPRHAQRKKEMQAIQEGKSRIASLPPGQEKPEAVPIPDESSMWIAQLEQSSKEIASFYRLPVHWLLGGNAAYGSIVQQSLDYVLHCIQPITQNIDAEINLKLMDDSHYVETMLEGQLRGDQETVQRILSALLHDRIISEEIYREKLNMPRDRIAGDTYQNSVQLQPDEPQEPEADDDEETDDANN